MSWILPDISDLPAGGVVRTGLGAFDSTAYQRAYYHAKRKGKGRRVQKRSPEGLARRREQRAKAYRENIEHERALARARYWKNRDRYAAAARERAAAKRRK